MPRPSVMARARRGEGLSKDFDEWCRNASSDELAQKRLDWRVLGEKKLERLDYEIRRRREQAGEQRDKAISRRAWIAVGVAAAALIVAILLA